MSNLKMYILVRDDVPLGNAMVAVAHASLAGYLAFKESQDMTDWLSGSFRKVVCMANAKEFAKGKGVEDNVVITESTLGDREVAIVFKPRADWPRVLRFARRYEQAPLVDKSEKLKTNADDNTR